jgi:carbon monoxide dehydrogenase subunit G
MKLTNEFFVAAPIDRIWTTLLDIRRVAQCLPGATVESDGADGTYWGRIRLKLGPMNMAYTGAVRLTDIDERVHSVTLAAEAKELRGPGTATARIRNRLCATDDGQTKAIVETDLEITGRPAQLGRGIMEDVVQNMVADFAERLRAEVLSDGIAVDTAPIGAPADSRPPAPTTAGSASSAPVPRAATSQGDQNGHTLDLGAALWRPLAMRAAVALAGLSLVVMLARARRRQR